MTSRTVAATASARATGDLAHVLASLPLSLAAATDGSADLHAIDGSAGWVERGEGAIRDGATGLVIVHPVAADATGLLAAAAAGDVSIVVDSPWAANPVMEQAWVRFRSARSRGSRLEVLAVVSRTESLDAALLDVLLLVAALLGTVDALHPLSTTEHGLQAVASAAGTAVDILVVLSDAQAPYAVVRLITADGGVELEVPSWATAQPARLVVTTPAGAMTIPTIYESAHRSSWRRLLRLVAERRIGDDLGRLKASAALILHGSGIG